MATVTASGSEMSVTPVSRGSATVTVTATDVDGSNTSAAQAFAVLVDGGGGNRAPEAVGTLSDRALEVGEALALDLSAAFRDQDGGAVDTLAVGVRGSMYTDRRAEPGASYTYQVAAVVDGGESSRSALVPVRLPCSYTVTPLHRDVLWPAANGAVLVTTGRPAHGRQRASRRSWR